MKNGSILEPSLLGQGQSCYFPGQAHFIGKEEAERTALEWRKQINKNVNLVEKSCPRLAVGRDKTGMVSPG